MRETKFEILRISGMVMIVAHHFLCHGLEPVAGSEAMFDGGRIASSFLLYGVNLFLLISGYFRIRLKWSSVFGLIFICSFYKVFHLSWDTFVLDIPHSMREWILKPLFVVSHPGGWFLEVYFQLMLISVLINKGLDNINDREYGIVMAGALAVSVYLGFAMRQSVNAWGYDLMQFVSMYIAGDAIRRYKVNRYLRSRSWTWIYVSCSIIIAAMYMWLNGTGSEWSENIFGRNNPLVIAGSVALFCAFCNMGAWSNGIVNRVAASMLPVYLVSDGGNFGTRLYEYLGYIYSTNGIAGSVMISAGIMGALFAGVMATDMVRIYIWKAASTHLISGIRTRIAERAL